MPNPIVPSVTLTDNGDGTVAVQISGGDAGQVNTIYTQPADGNIRVPNWTSQGSLTGNGLLTLTLGPGIYWGQCQASENNQTLVAPLQVFGATNAVYGLQEQVLQAVISRLQGMTFNGQTGSAKGLTTIYNDLATPDDRALNFPLLWVSVDGVTWSVQAATNAREDYGLGVAIFLVDQWGPPSRAYSQAARAKYTTWQEQIVRAFVSQRLGGVPDVFNCIANPGPIVDRGILSDGYYMWPLLLRFMLRESRGIISYTGGN